MGLLPVLYLVQLCDANNRESEIDIAFLKMVKERLSANDWVSIRFKFCFVLFFFTLGSKLTGLDRFLFSYFRLRFFFFSIFMFLFLIFRFLPE